MKTDRVDIEKSVSVNQEQALSVDACPLEESSSLSIKSPSLNPTRSAKEGRIGVWTGRIRSRPNVESFYSQDGDPFLTLSTARSSQANPISPIFSANADTDDEGNNYAFSPPIIAPANPAIWRKEKGDGEVVETVGLEEIFAKPSVRAAAMGASLPVRRGVTPVRNHGGMKMGKSVKIGNPFSWIKNWRKPSSIRGHCEVSKDVESVKIFTSRPFRKQSKETKKESPYTSADEEAPRMRFGGRMRSKSVTKPHPIITKELTETTTAQVVAPVSKTPIRSTTSKDDKSQRHSEEEPTMVEEQEQALSRLFAKFPLVFGRNVQVFPLDVQSFTFKGSDGSEGGSRATSRGRQRTMTNPSTESVPACECKRDKSLPPPITRQDPIAPSRRRSEVPNNENSGQNASASTFGSAVSFDSITAFQYCDDLRDDVVFRRSEDSALVSTGRQALLARGHDSDGDCGWSPVVPVAASELLWGCERNSGELSRVD
ncbi:hypothetical protein BC829DRAFT_392804 [Chytridium lagenaria]|nr:hypothetical protein BC829DRAFT_392804 [Chytridium lagenaria]